MSGSLVSNFTNQQIYKTNTGDFIYATSFCLVLGLSIRVIQFHYFIGFVKVVKQQ